MGRSKGSGRDNDPTLAQKKRARRRLIGAFTLALTAVIVVPMVFDSKPNLPPQDLVIKIPDPDHATPLPDTKESNTEATEPAKLLETPAAEVQTDVKTDIKPDTPAQTELKPEPKVEPKVEAPKPPPVATVNANPQATEAKRAQAALTGKLGSAEAKVEAGQFVVQLGAYSSADKVKQLQGKLSAAGIESFTQKVHADKGEVIRLRVGPFADRAAADTMVKKVKAAGLNGTVMAAK